jgi:hypothetical protein
MPSLNLMHASSEWADRPDDERFWNLDEMQAATAFNRRTSTEAVVDLAQARIEAHPGRRSMYFIDGEANAPIPSSRLSNYAFGQLCRTFEAPASYLRTLPVDLAVDCMEDGRRRWLAHGGAAATRQLLYQGRESGEAILRAATSERYVRVWNAEIVERLQGLREQGWVVPPARPVDIDSPRTRIATEDDVIDYGHESALTVKAGDTIGPAGLYASDHDMFAFLIHPDVVIEDGESPGGLRRGTMVRQSEVGDCAIWKLDFLLNTVCGNHIVWGAQDVRETRVRHTGSEVGERWMAMVRSISEYAQGSAAEQEAQIRNAKELVLGDSREEVMDFLFGKRMLGKRDAGAAYDLAEEFESVHGNPRSLWGMVQGVTRLSQQTAHADSRASLDIAAGKILAQAISLN